MRKTNRFLSLFIAIAVVSALPLLGSADKSDPWPAEGFTANLVDSANLIPGLTTAFFRLHIDEYGDVTMARNLLELLADEGQQGLRARLEKQEVGWIQIGSGNVSYPVSFARTFEEDGGRLLRAVIARPMGFAELSRNWRTTDYPFSVVELRLDDDGQGSGVLVPATKLEFDKDGSLVVENYSYAPFQLLNVRPMTSTPGSQD